MTYQLRLAIVAFAAVTVCSSVAKAQTRRYAVVIGNNDGALANSERLPALRHAERDARRLGTALSEFANFPTDPQRTTVLLGPTREQVRRAFANLAALKAADAKQMPTDKSLLAVFFTGHGVEGKLLMADGPLDATELGGLIHNVEADFTVGVFDACYSGSMDRSMLKDKGFTVLSKRLVDAMPNEVLASEGSVLFVSSAPNQVSFEDANLGGVFTHFFTEALSTYARGPGVTLDEIWQRARDGTVAFTRERGVLQTPQMYVSSLRTSAPLYFSFPQPRRGTLRFAKDVAGDFVLAYADGQFTETLSKAAGSPLDVPVFVGSLRVMELSLGATVVSGEFDVPQDGVVVLHRNPTPQKPGLGRTASKLWSKGGVDAQLQASAVVPGSSWLLLAGYSRGLSSEALLSPADLAHVAARWDRKLFTVGLGAAYGQEHARFPSWSFDAHSLLLEANGGVALDLGSVRLALLAIAGGQHTWQTFADGTNRGAFAWRMGGGLNAIWMLSDWLGPFVEVRGGSGSFANIAARGDSVLRPWVQGMAGVGMRIGN